MNRKPPSEWEGLLLALWVAAISLLVITLFPSHLEATWPNIAGFVLLLFAWWGIGLPLAVSGLRHGPAPRRICAGASMCYATAFFVWFFFFNEVAAREQLNKRLETTRLALPVYSYITCRAAPARR